MFKKIGNEKILSLNLKENWTKDMLHETLTNTLCPMNINEKSYSIFYLKLFGTYDKSIIPFNEDEELKCYYCPNNPKYKKFWEYNQLRDNKIPVLVLVSKYIDFKDYDIYAAYYADKIIDSSNVELWGTKKSLWKKVQELIGLY